MIVFNFKKDDDKSPLLEAMIASYENDYNTHKIMSYAAKLEEKYLNESGIDIFLEANNFSLFIDKIRQSLGLSINKIDRIYNKSINKISDHIKTLNNISRNNNININNTKFNGYEKLIKLKVPKEFNFNPKLVLELNFEDHYEKDKSKIESEKNKNRGFILGNKNKEYSASEFKDAAYNIIYGEKKEFIISKDMGSDIKNAHMILDSFKNDLTKIRKSTISRIEDFINELDDDSRTILNDDAYNDSVSYTKNSKENMRKIALDKIEIMKYMVNDYTILFGLLADSADKFYKQSMGIYAKNNIRK